MPLIAFDFAFRGGANQDPVDKPGVASMATALLDEGAGEFDSKTFHERIEAKAIELGFGADRDHSSRLAAHADRQSGRSRRAAAAGAHVAAFRCERCRAHPRPGCCRVCGAKPPAPTRWRASAGGRPRSPAIPMAGRCAAPSNRFRPSRRVISRITCGGCSPATRSRSPSSATSTPPTAGKLIDKVFGGLPAKGDLVAGPAGDAAGPRPEDRDRSRRSAVGRDARRRRHRAQRPRFHGRFRGQPHARRRLVLLAALPRGARGARARLFGVQHPVPLDHAVAVHDRHGDAGRSRRADARSARNRNPPPR